MILLFWLAAMITYAVVHIAITGSLFAGAGIPLYDGFVFHKEEE